MWRCSAILYGPAQVNLFHVGLTLCGQPDLLMRDGGGSIVIVDWKRSKQIEFENGWRCLQYPLEHLPDCNGFLYSLQLNVYRYMLETENGYTVTAMLLAVCHPDLEAPRLIECPRMDREMTSIVEYEIECGRATAAALPIDAPFLVP